ncbi:MAG: O-antigen ligase family protein, partial [Clostridia bacterium]|nr:O-antigen ligase family protein [Clostridia bacterium]
MAASIRNKILNNEIYVKCSNYFTKLFKSNIFLAFIATLAFLSFICHQEIVAMFIILFFLAINLIFVEDLSYFYLAMVVMSLIPMQYGHHDGDIADFILVAYSFIYLAPAIGFRLFVFPFKFIGGTNFIPLLLYSIVLVLGGFLSDITIAEYFSGVPIYTVFGLGFLQLVLYIFFQNYLRENPNKLIKTFAKMSVVISAISVALVLHALIKHMIEVKALDFNFPVLSWKNYICDIFMFTMPFSFYFAVKSKYRIPFILFGFVQYACMFLVRSGGGLLFGTIMMPFLIIYTIVKTPKKSRKFVLITLAIIILAAIGAVIWKRNYVIDLLKGKIDSGGTGRMDIYEIAWAEFLKYPILGCGLGIDFTQFPIMVYYGFDMTYFHSSVFQALGATGIIGLIIYTYLALVRLKTFIGFKIRTFNVFLLIGFLAFALYSVVDVA